MTSARGTPPVEPAGSSATLEQGRGARDFWATATGSGWRWPRDGPGFAPDAFPLPAPDLLGDLLRKGAEIAEQALLAKEQKRREQQWVPSEKQSRLKRR